MPDLQSSKATHSRFGNGLLQKISTMRSTVWRPKAAFPSTRWTGSPTFGSRLGPNINGYENANPNIPTRQKTAVLHRLRKSAASCRKLRRIAASCGLNPIRIRIRILIRIRIQVPPMPPKGAGLPNFGRNIPRKSAKAQRKRLLSVSSRISRPLTA